MSNFKEYPTMTDETHPKPTTRQRIWSIVSYPVRTPMRLFIFLTMILAIFSVVALLSPSAIQTQKGTVFYFPLLLSPYIVISPFLFFVIGYLIVPFWYIKLNSLSRGGVFFLVGIALILWLLAVMGPTIGTEHVESYEQDGHVYHWACPLFNSFPPEYPCVLYECDSTGIFCNVSDDEGRPCYDCNDNWGW
jgi:hypothetical protein